MDHRVGQRQQNWPHPKCQLPLLNDSECQVLSPGTCCLWVLPTRGVFAIYPCWFQRAWLAEWMNEFCKEVQEDEDREDVLAERKASGPGEGSAVVSVGPDNLSLSSFLGTHSRRTEPTAASCPRTSTRALWHACPPQINKCNHIFKWRH